MISYLPPDVSIALIGLAGSALGTFAGIVSTSRLTQYRLKKIEEKLEKHNNLVARMYQVEQRTELQEEKIKVANHRIDDLEKFERSITT